MNASDYGKKWLKIGISAKDTNEKLARRLVLQVYTPKLILFCDSPLACIHFFSRLKNSGKEILYTIDDRPQYQASMSIKKYMGQRRRYLIWKDILRETENKIWDGMQIPILNQIWERTTLP